MAVRSKTITRKTAVRKRTATRKSAATPKPKAPRLPAQTPEMCAYALDMLQPRVEKMLSHAEGATSGEEPRAIHQMRVWSRRSRAALDIFNTCFPGKTYRELASEVKAVTRALGEARDLDVMLETLQKRADALPETQRMGVESFRRYLEATRQQKQNAVVDAVKRLNDSDLVAQLHALGDQVGYHPMPAIEVAKEAAPASGEASAEPQAEPMTGSPSQDASRTLEAQQESQETHG